jgi:hypothetical protein
MATNGDLHPAHTKSGLTDMEMTLMFTAAAMLPTLAQASAYLKDEHNLRISVGKIEVLKRRFPEWEEKVRAQLAPRIEARAANDMLDIATLCGQVEREAVLLTYQFLDEGKIADPSKAARDLADVKAKNIDKRLALQGRPTSIVEMRKPDEILRALEGLGIFKPTDAETTAEEIPDELPI